MMKIWGFDRMLMVARITCENEGYLDTNHDEVWQQVKNNHKGWRGNEDVTLMYLTKRFIPGETSLIADVADANSFLGFLEDNILTLDSVSGAYIFNLMKSTFFPIPKGTCLDLKRFTVTINAEPKNCKDIYDTISKIPPKKYFLIGYLAYTFQEHGSDIMVSILAKGTSDAKSGVKEHIETIKGVKNTEIIRITRTKRLYSPSRANRLKGGSDVLDETPGLESF
jgi:hypothetical protein